jgi:hypothetical protein
MSGSPLAVTDWLTDCVVGDGSCTRGLDGDKSGEDGACWLKKNSWRKLTHLKEHMAWQMKTRIEYQSICKETLTHSKSHILQKSYYQIEYQGICNRCLKFTIIQNGTRFETNKKKLGKIKYFTIASSAVV